MVGENIARARLNIADPRGVRLVAHSGERHVHAQVQATVQ